jgi:hypothetical protein
MSHSRRQARQAGRLRAERAAAMYSLIVTAKLSNVNPCAGPADLAAA